MITPTQIYKRKNYSNCFKFLPLEVSSLEYYQRYWLQIAKLAGKLAIIEITFHLNCHHRRLGMFAKIQYHNGIVSVTYREH